MGAIIPIAALVVSAGSAVAQSQAASKSAKFQKEGREVSAAEEQSQLISNKRQEFRQRRVREATIRASSQATGTTGSSGEGGALSILSTNVAANTAEISRRIGTVQTITGLAQKQADAGLREQIAGSVGQIAGSVFSASMADPKTNRQFRNIFTGEGEG